MKKTRILACLMALVLLIASLPVAALASKTMYVKKNVRLNVRTVMEIKPRTVITTLKGGTKVTVLSETGKWSKITWGSSKSNKGYVMSKYLTSGSSGSSTPDPIGLGIRYVKTPSGNGVNMRYGPSTDYGIMKIVRDGAKVTVLKTGKLWCKVVYGGKVGYIFAKYLSKTK